MHNVQIDILTHADFSGRLRRTKKHPGHAVYATAIENLRRQNPEGTLLLDAGDEFSTTFWGGLPMVKAVSLAGTDAMTLGNHEFDRGEEWLQTCIDAADFPILCANVVRKPDGNLIPGVKPWMMLEKKGVKIGVLGITTEYTPYMVTATSIAPFQMLSCVDTCRRYIPEMKAAGAQITVLLAHIPFYIEDGVISGELVDILQQIPEVDVCIGGHIPGDYAGLWNNTVVLKGGFGGVILPHVTITFDTDTGCITDKTCCVHQTDRNLEPLPVYKAYADSITAPFDDFFEKPLAYTDEVWSIRLSYETKLGNFLAQCVEEAAGTEIAYMNATSSGGTIQPGPVTAEDITGVMGFDDPILKAEITGKQIYELFELVYVPERYGNNAGLMYSGLIVHADHTRPAFQKIQKITLRDGTPIDPDRTYTIATSEYMSTGGNDTGLVAKQLHWEEIGVKMYDALFASIEKHGCLYVTPEQRMHAIGHPENDNAPF